MAALSYVHGASTQPLIGKTIGALFDETCEANPERLALVSRHQNIRWTYAQLKTRVDAFAAGLIALGLEPGERIGIWAPNCAEWAVTQFATAKAGLILVNINPAYRLTEAEYAINKVGCRALVIAVRHKTSEYLGMIRELREGGRLPTVEAVITLGDDPHRGCQSFPHIENTAKRADRARLAELGPTLQFDDPINIQFTSGTTGFPKGATLSHHNILNNGFFTGEAMKLQAGDAVCIPVPLYHCFGMVIGNLGCVTHAATMVYPSEGFDPAAALQAVEAERCVALFGVPTMFIAMLGQADFDRYDLKSLRTGAMGGSPCPIEVMRQVIDRMHMGQVTNVYGMTETSPVSFQTNTEDSLERRVSTVGRVQAHQEVKIIDAEGRIKDMVIRGGENIYPREIEEYLYRHPAIQDVQVIGIPDTKYGEELCAWIVLKSGHTLEDQAVRDFCRDQIAHYKIPRHIRFVEGFPTTVTGKVQKFAMREAMIAELDLALEKTA